MDGYGYGSWWMDMDITPKIAWDSDPLWVREDATTVGAPGGSSLRHGRHGRAVSGPTSFRYSRSPEEMEYVMIWDMRYEIWDMRYAMILIWNWYEMIWYDIDIYWYDMWHLDKANLRFCAIFLTEIPKFYLLHCSTYHNDHLFLAAHRCSCGIELDLAGTSDVIRVDVHQQNMMIIRLNEP